MKRYRGYSNSFKGQHLVGAGLQFRGLVHYHYGRKHGGVQADMVLEKTRVLRLDLKASGDYVPHWA